MRKFFHQIRELREQVMRIVRPGRSFRVILHAEERQVLMAHALVGVVVQIKMGDFDIAGRQRFGIDTKAVILGGDFHLIGQKIFHRMIRAVMAEFQLERFSAQRDPAKLVAKADAEDRHTPCQFANVIDRVSDGLGIPWAIGKKHAIRAQ